MFSYCRNNPTSRTDISGTYDIECDTSNPLDDEDEHEEGGLSGGNQGLVAGQANNCVRSGTGHGNPSHKANIDQHLDELANSGDYQKVFGNRSLNTAGLNGNQRPDIIAIHNDGSVDIWEYASPSQATGTPGYRALEAKIELMQAANPNATFHKNVPWEGIEQR